MYNKNNSFFIMRFAYTKPMPPPRISLHKSSAGATSEKEMYQLIWKRFLSPTI